MQGVSPLGARFFHPCKKYTSVVPKNHTDRRYLSNNTIIEYIDENLNTISRNIKISITP